MILEGVKKASKEEQQSIALSMKPMKHNNEKHGIIKLHGTIGAHLPWC